MCDRCENEVLPQEDDITFSPNPEWGDAYLCRDCADAVAAEYEPYDVECWECGRDLGTNEENMALPANSMLGQALGAEDADEAVIFVCDKCRDENTSVSFD